MNHYVIAVKDRAVDAFNRPFTTRTKGEAIRSFTDEAHRADSEIAKHPQDYDLYCLGEYDDQSGSITGYERPELIVRAQDLKD